MKREPPVKPLPKLLALAKKPDGDGLDEHDWRRYCRQCSNLNREGKCVVRNAKMLDDLPRHCGDFRWNGRAIPKAG